MIDASICKLVLLRSLIAKERWRAEQPLLNVTGRETCRTTCRKFWQSEAVFFVLWRSKKAALDEIPEQHAPEEHDGWALFEKWHSSSHYNVKVLAIAELIKCWFDNVPIMEIRRGNAAELVARGYFYKTMDQLRAEGKEGLVEEMLLAIERVWGYRFEDGLNPDLQYLDHLQEPLKAHYRPLAFYLFCEGMAAAKHAMLLAAAFKGHSYGAYTYYTYNLPTEWQAAHGQLASRDHLHPIIFLHGVGAGLLPYIPFLLRTTALGRPLLAVEYKHLSMRWTDHIPTAPEVARDMSAMFDLHGIRKASMVAHSYGTFYVSCLLKLAPEKVHSMALIDPVCCCMWSGHLISNFVYSPARSTTGLITWLIARDIHTATSVSRNFFWTDVNMWPDEVPQRSLFVLSDKDDLVPVQHVAAMLTHDVPAARIMHHPTMHHADFLFSPAWQDTILSHVAEMVQMPSGSPKDPSSPTAAAAAAAAAAVHGGVQEAME
ncbi:hypothetical protein OEZ85_014374 [Tetradesmus obliquus]|uniref:AB hydrolase-1 domain-containing protein n=1 Tax=Tetradesmus obliquus TaxID=3088 RepID=A0ABY8U856_TETOB|nr:hypothetical protein OEZ85_014374 [Tetradesmus obliquus]